MQRHTHRQTFRELTLTGDIVKVMDYRLADAVTSTTTKQIPGKSARTHQSGTGSVDMSLYKR